MTVVLYHNPKCSTSRNALALLRERGIEPTVIEYLKTGWDRATLERLAARTGGGLSGPDAPQGGRGQGPAGRRRR